MLNLSWKLRNCTLSSTIFRATETAGAEDDIGLTKQEGSWEAFLTLDLTC